MSLAPLAYGAAVSWGLAANRDLGLPAVLDAFVFEDAAGVLGASLEALGGVYAGTGLLGLNGSPLFTELVPDRLLGALGTPDAASVRSVIETLDADDRRARARPAGRAPTVR